MRFLDILAAKTLFFDEYKIDCIKEYFTDQNRVYDILDYGCGVGKLTGPLGKAYPNSHVCGWDISAESLHVARKDYKDEKNVYFLENLTNDKKFDFILVVMVFHHIEPEGRAKEMNDLKNLLKLGGRVIIFEHNPFNLATRYIVKHCPFDADAVLMTQKKLVKLAESCGFKVNLKKYIVFFPWPGKIFRFIERLFGFLPLGAQYMIVLE